MCVRETEEHKGIKREEGEGIVCKLNSSTSQCEGHSVTPIPSMFFAIETSLDASIPASEHICFSINKQIESSCPQKRLCLLFSLIDAK